MGQPLRGGEMCMKKKQRDFFGVIPCIAMFTRRKLLQKTIFGFSPVGNPDEGGLERCTSGYCLFKIRILA
jgi:hypothetical protein